MSIDVPQTLEEWKAFHFPSSPVAGWPGRGGSEAVDAPSAEEEGDPAGEGDGGKDGGSGTASGGGPAWQPGASDAAAEAVTSTDPVAPATVDSPKGKGGTRKPRSTKACSPVVEPVEVAAAAPAETASIAEAPMDPAQVVLEPVPAPPVASDPALPVPSPTHPSTWTYDAARGLIINWRDERMVSLPRHLNTLPMILRHLAIIESRQMDHLGFIQALNRACLDVHGKTLKELIRSLPNGSQQTISWGDLPSEKISLGTERRRRLGVR